MFKTILEIYDSERDTWSRINGCWKGEKGLDEHIEYLKKGSSNCVYYKCSKGHTNIPENYKYTIFNFYARYPSAEKRNEAVDNFYKKYGYPERICPLII